MSDPVGEGFAASYAQRGAIAKLAFEKGMPTECEQRDFSISGCLVSYGPSFDAMYRRAAYYVDKILKGAKPTDLPIESRRSLS